MGFAAIGFRGTTLIADPAGALFWPDQAMLIVADLHLGKGSAWAHRGALLPPYDTRQTLLRLRDVVARWAPRRIVSLGDGFHDQAAGERLAAADRALLAELTGRHDWLWLSGNHDPAPPTGIGGRTAPSLKVAGICLRHLPGVDAGAEVAGHLHPVVRLQRAGRGLVRRCFVVDKQRLLLPAFGSYTGGLSLKDPAVAALFPQDYRAYLLGRRVHVLARHQVASGAG